jgi:acyl dehydratase
VRYFEDVAAGEEIPFAPREITRTAMVMYAAATWDFHRFHHDAAFVQARGHPAPFVDGQMLGALLAQQLMDWAGPDAFVCRLAFRFRAMVYAGDRLTGRGHVTGTEVAGARRLALCTLSLAKADGTVVIADATAAVDLPGRPGRPPAP